MKRLFVRTGKEHERAPQTDEASLRLAAARGRALIEESRELVAVLDDAGRVLASSRRAREEVGSLHEGARLSAAVAVTISYEADGRRESLVYLAEPEADSYAGLRTAFTAAVSHELRTPLARLLVVLESAQLPGADVDELVEQARGEVEGIRELIDDVLFLSELETGREVVALGATMALPVLRELAAELAPSAERAGVTIHVDGDEEAEVPLRPRMLRVVAENLAQNAIRYAGEGATFRLSARRQNDSVVLSAVDDGAGVDESDLPRLFERFYRADRARASRGTGLGLAIVKHVITSAGGAVDASSEPGRGLGIRCVFPSDSLRAG
jgi:two-component system, OmpR family, phosphate regulon sensor histidine kinase PhoR